MVDRFIAGLRVFRPRTVMQMRKSLDDSTRDLHQLTEAVSTLSQQITALQSSIQQQGLDIAAIRTQAAQLRVVAERNLEFKPRDASLDALLDDPMLPRHVSAAIDGARLRSRPCPFCVVDDMLPEPLYQALIDGLPPVELFADRPVNNQQLNVPFLFAPDYSRRIWQFMADRIVNEMMLPAITQKFRAPLEHWIRTSFAVPEGDALAALRLVSSDGRILLRTNGYHIPPHRDPKWGFLTCIFYLARPGDDKRWGTDLYELDEDHEAIGAAPHWIEHTTPRRVETVKFYRNRALIFLNSTGAHGADIPADAEPPMLQRYVYQFRIGPDAASMAALMAGLPPERRVYWEGKLRGKRAMS